MMRNLGGLLIVAGVLAGCGAKEPEPKADPNVLLLQCQGVYRSSGGRVQPTVRAYRVNLQAKTIERYEQGSATWETVPRGPVEFNQAEITANKVEVVEGISERTTFEINRLTGQIVDGFEASATHSSVGFAFEGTCEKSDTPTIPAKF